MINVSRFCSTLATLLNSGVPILLSLKIVKNLVSNVHMQQAVQDAQVSIGEGATLAGPLKSSGLFPSMVTHMISLGEKSGELEPMLEIISDNYSDQVENKLSGLASTLEPIMIIFMGLAVLHLFFILKALKLIQIFCSSNAVDKNSSSIFIGSNISSLSISLIFILQ